MTSRFALPALSSLFVALCACGMGEEVRPEPVGRIAEELLAWAGPGDAVAAPAALAEHLLGRPDLSTALVTGHHPRLSAQAPIVAVAHAGGRVLNAVRFEQTDAGGRLLLADGRTQALTGAPDAVALIALLTRGLGADRGALQVTLFRDSEVVLPAAMQGLDGAASTGCGASADEIEPIETNWCHHWAFCRNDPNNGPSCNAFTGKCNRKVVVTGQ